ncbi:MAG: iron-containing redox enzyme family protein [Bdellovibrio sp.]|nr:iron-containing redox enzyme family protein [Bdellovibrio sp.]
MKPTSSLIPFHIPAQHFSLLKEKCYDLWQEVWPLTFAELGVNKKMSADEFLDRHIYGLKTSDNKVCGFMLIRDFQANALTLQHSYFDNYPQVLKQELGNSYESISVITYMTIASQWRKSNTDLPLSEIIMGLCVLHFLNGSTEKLWGYFRNNRKTQEIFYRHGGIPKAQDHWAYNVQVDVSYITHESAHLSTLQNCKVQTFNFWQQIKKKETLMNLDMNDNLAFQRLSEEFDKMPWNDLKFYQNWLMQSYYYTAHSTRMLALAAGWTETDETSYYRRSLSHIREEQGHDMMAFKDAEGLGCKTHLVKELGSTRALWEPQFYKIQKSPLSLLGYILCLEMLAVKHFPALLSKLKQSHPSGKHDFVRVHAEDDPDHVDEALIQIAHCSENQIALIIKNFEQTADLYRFMLQESANMALYQSAPLAAGHSKTYSTRNVEAQPTATPAVL